MIKRVVLAGLLIGVASGSHVSAQEYPPTSTTIPATTTTIPGTTTTVPASGESTTTVPAPTVVIDQTELDPGGTFTVSAECVVPVPVEFAFLDQTVESPCEPTGISSPQSTGSGPVFDGIAEATFVAPDAAGEYVVTAAQPSLGILTEFTVTVSGSPGVTTPVTGGSAAATALPIAIGLLVVGASMFLVATTRRRPARSHG